MIDPGHASITVRLFFHVHLHNLSAGFGPLLSVDTHNIAYRAAYYSVECLYPLFFRSPPGTYGATVVFTKLIGMIQGKLVEIRLCDMDRFRLSSLQNTLEK